MMDAVSDLILTARGKERVGIRCTHRRDEPLAIVAQIIASRSHRGNTEPMHEFGTDGQCLRRWRIIFSLPDEFELFVQLCDPVIQQGLKAFR